MKMRVEKFQKNVWMKLYFSFGYTKYTRCHTYVIMFYSLYSTNIKPQKQKKKKEGIFKVYNIIHTHIFVKEASIE